MRRAAADVRGKRRTQMTAGRRDRHREARPRFCPIALLVAGLRSLVLVLLVASLAIGYAPLDSAQAFRDVLHGRRTLAALVLVELRVAARAPRAPRRLQPRPHRCRHAGPAAQSARRSRASSACPGTAALGAVTVFYFGLAGTVSLALPLGGVAGAAVATFLLYGLAGRGAGTMTLILAGVAINSFAGALTSLALNLAPNPFAVTEIVYWLLGSLADRSLPYVWLVLPLMLVGWALLLMSGPPLDALTLGRGHRPEPRLQSRPPAAAAHCRHRARRSAARWR